MKNSKLLVGVSIGLVLLVSLIGIVYFSTPNEPMEPTNARHYNINVTDNFIVDEKKNSAP